MKFSKTFVNKLISYTDRHFTYDSRYIKCEDPTRHFDFVAFNHDNNTAVFIRRSRHGIWVSIRKGAKDIHTGFLTTYQEVNTFKQMVLCLG